MMIMQSVIPRAKDAWNAELIAMRRIIITAESKIRQMNILKESPDAAR
jgi:hypothetical protein